MWFELTAAQPSAAVGFYAEVLDWQASVSETYVELLSGGTSVPGCADLSQGTTGWLPYFTVADPGAKAEQAQALGGEVVLPLTTFPGGSCTIVRDPDGAVFGLMRNDS